MGPAGPNGVRRGGRLTPRSFRKRAVSTMPHEGRAVSTGVDMRSAAVRASMVRWSAASVPRSRSRPSASGRPACLRSRSASETMPMGWWRVSTTGRAETSLYARLQATVLSDASGLAVATSRVLTSATVRCIMVRSLLRAGACRDARRWRRCRFTGRRAGHGRPPGARRVRDRPRGRSHDSRPRPPRRAVRRGRPGSRAGYGSPVGLPG